jgi:pilus assembly protein CpaF
VTTFLPFVAGPLRGLLETPGVTDVLVNGPDEVWIDRGMGLERASVGFGSAGDVRELAVRLASLGGRRLDDACPLVDARLPDGTRLHAALPPVVDGCAAISLRTVRRGALTLEDLELCGTLTPGLAPVLAGLVAGRASLLITGATGSGKTTLLASLLSLVDPSERIVVIEEAGEVNPTHPHVVRLVERRANVDGAGAVEVSRLVREALRMRPDRIVLGECRGPEVRDVLTALNTGHRGGMATLHANAPADVPARLAALGALAGMDARATDLHAAAAFQAVIHLEKTSAGRRVTEIAILRADEGSRSARLRVRAALRVGADGRVEVGPAWAEVEALLPAASEGTAPEETPPAGIGTLGIRGVGIRGVGIATLGIAA